jgi:MoaA/NifB/PqqE/SkfB family radical SAM enzyme
LKRLLKNDLDVINLGNWGEPFLNPHMVEILGLLRGHKVGILTNLNYLTDEVAEALSEVNRIVVSLDGACQQTYEQYRVGGDFNHVLENVQKIHGPELVWQFLVFGHTSMR